MEALVENLKEMSNNEPIKYASEDYEKGYNSGYYEALTELSSRLGIPIDIEEESNAITKESLNLHLRLKRNLEDRVHHVLFKKTEIENGKGFCGEIVEFDIIASQMSVTTQSSYCRCCSDERKHHDFPKEYLYSDDWIETLKERVKKANERVEQKKQEDEKETAARQEQAEREQLKLLIAKYGTPE